MPNREEAEEEEDMRSLLSITTLFIHVVCLSPQGASSSKDFYKKHHRWTEGLISAAKAVGWGANVLV